MQNLASLHFYYIKLLLIFTFFICWLGNPVFICRWIYMALEEYFDLALSSHFS